MKAQKRARRFKASQQALHHELARGYALGLAAAGFKVAPGGPDDGARTYSSYEFAGEYACWVENRPDIHSLSATHLGDAWSMWLADQDFARHPVAPS